MGGDPLAGAGEAETLLRRCLDADVPKTGMQCARDIPAHLLDMRRELWPLGDDGRIEVAEASASEWPSSPFSYGIVTPPKISARPETSR